MTNFGYFFIMWDIDIIRMCSWFWVTWCKKFCCVMFGFWVKPRSQYDAGAVSVTKHCECRRKYLYVPGLSYILNVQKFDILIDWILEMLRLWCWNRNQLYSRVTLITQCWHQHHIVSFVGIKQHNLYNRTRTLYMYIHVLWQNCLYCSKWWVCW